jgi:protein DGCR14
MKAVEEDEYIEGLSQVIERDFFPDLKRIRLQNSFLDAVNGMDLSAAAQYSKELAQLKDGSLF